MGIVKLVDRVEHNLRDINLVGIIQAFNQQGIEDISQLDIRLEDIVMFVDILNLQTIRDMLIIKDSQAVKDNQFVKGN